MTDEERSMLVRHLRTLGASPGLETCLDAADEIERLAAEVKRLDNLLDAYVERER